MKKAFHAPALPEVKSARAAIEGRPRGTVPTFRVRMPAEKKSTWQVLARAIARGHEQFFQRRPWVKTADL